MAIRKLAALQAGFGRLTSLRACYALCIAHLTSPILGRRVNTLCKHNTGLRQQLALFQMYPNFVLPYASLRQALAEPVPTKGTGAVAESFFHTLKTELIYPGKL